ncbi:ParB family protein (plasmid) [Pseudarthrobacter sp. P1]|uniref:ParB family protein n=1 Tax=Pseudarthrobacter sp. P1 TaxID=3418418 RepID=UPI003CF8754B
MSIPKPADDRTGSPDALALIRGKSGLRKARPTSVIAEMTADVEPVGEALAADRLHAVPDRPVDGPTDAPPAAAVPVPVDPAPAPVEVPAAPAQPVAPAPIQQQWVPQPPVYQAPVYQAPVQNIPAAAPEPVQVQQPPAAPKKEYRKTSFFQTRDSGARMRSAYMATRHLTGKRTLSDFILAAVEREVAELERAHNNGNQFDTDPDTVPRGRPLEN